MPTEDPVVAICFSDLHLSLRTPVARGAEQDWLGCFKRALDEIKGLSEKHQAIVLCAGDLFDRWDAPAELINWALEALPDLYAIPGNHDLPLHQVRDIKKSAFWTLVKAGKVSLLGEVPLPLTPPMGGTIWLYGIPFEKVLDPEWDDQGLRIALTHEYLWVPGKSYPGARQETRLRSRVKAFSPFHVVVVGDNHQGFSRTIKGRATTVFNCGTVLRRKISEASYHPQVGLIHSSGKITSHLLDTSQDKILTKHARKAGGEDPPTELVDFLEDLTNLQSRDDRLSFREAVRQVMISTKPPRDVRNLVLRALEIV